MPKIMIGDKDLNDCSPAEAFLAGAHPDRDIYNAGDRLDYHRNGDMLKMFGDRELLGVELAIGRYEATAPVFYTPAFNALRAGELMNWASQHDLVERIDGPAWRLIVREQQFELVGPENHQRAVRIRGLAGAEAVVGAKIWDRELKRRERARVKRVARIIEEARREIRYIGRHEPDLKLGNELAQFAIGDVDTVAAAEDYIADSMLPLDVRAANVIATAVSHLYIDVCARQTEIKTAERRRRDAEDMAALSEMFADRAAANPQPPRRMPTAEVECTRTGSKYHYIITGTQAGVEAEAEDLRESYRGYSMGVAPAVEVEPGVWQARGSRWDNCD